MSNLPLHHHEPAPIPIIPYLAIIIALAIAVPSVITIPHRLAFLLYAGSVLLILRTHEAQDDQSYSRRLWTGVGIIAIAFLIGSRLLPLMRFGVTALGYDTGFYVQYFRLLTDLRTLDPHVISTSHLVYSSWFPFTILKFPPFTTILALHVFHQLATAAALYFLVRSLGPRDRTASSATIAVALFALSINQFLGYWWMFYKQSMAIPFFLVAIGLVFRGSWIAIPAFGVAASIHLQSAVPFLIAGVAYITVSMAHTVFRHRRLDPWIIRVAAGLLTAILLMVLIKTPRELQFYVQYVVGLRGFATNALQWEIEAAKGLFITPAAAFIHLRFLLPFAIIGILTAIAELQRDASPVRNRRTGVLLAIIATLLVLTAFPFIYQNRLLIFLDLFLIVIAAHPIERFVSTLRHLPLKRLIGCVFIGGWALSTILFVWNQEPDLTRAEARELLRLPTIMEPNAYVMATSAIYTPWVYAMTNRDTIAPGALNWDRWDLPQWIDFWEGRSDVRRHELLRKYGDVPLYLFVGEHQRVSAPLRAFLQQDPAIRKVDAHVWRYRSFPL